MRLLRVKSYPYVFYKNDVALTVDRGGIIIRHYDNASALPLINNKLDVVLESGEWKNVSKKIMQEAMDEILSLTERRASSRS